MGSDTLTNEPAWVGKVNAALEEFHAEVRAGLRHLDGDSACGRMGSLLEAAIEAAFFAEGVPTPLDAISVRGSVVAAFLEEAERAMPGSLAMTDEYLAAAKALVRIQADAFEDFKVAEKRRGIELGQSVFDALFANQAALASDAPILQSALLHFFETPDRKTAKSLELMAGLEIDKAWQLDRYDDKGALGAKAEVPRVAFFLRLAGSAFHRYYGHLETRWDDEFPPVLARVLGELTAQAVGQVAVEHREFTFVGGEAKPKWLALNPLAIAQRALSFDVPALAISERPPAAERKAGGNIRPAL